jgi:hypothetical protein
MTGRSLSNGMGIFAAALIVGILAGLLPFLLGRRYGQKKLAIASLTCSIIAGLASEIIAACRSVDLVAIILVRKNLVPKPETSNDTGKAPRA